MTLIVERRSADNDVDADECVAILSSSTAPIRRGSLFVPVAAASTTSFTGITITIVTSLAYASVAAVSRHINTAYSVPLTELMVLLVGFQFVPAVLGLMLQNSTSLLFDRSLWRDHGWRLVVRGICGVLVNLLQLTAMTKMPIGNAAVVFWTCPIFVALISLLFLGERITPVKVACIAASLAGCALVTKSEALFPTAAVVTLANQQTTADHPWAFLYALGASLMQATAFVVLRALREVNPLVINAYYGLIGGIASALWAVASSADSLVMPFKAATSGSVAWPLLLLLASALNGAANVAQSYACGRENANVIGVVSSLELVFTYAWQVIFFREVPHWICIVGALLVTASVVLLGVEKGIVKKAVISSSVPPTPAMSRKNADANGSSDSWGNGHANNGKSYQP